MLLTKMKRKIKHRSVLTRVDGRTLHVIKKLHRHCILSYLFNVTALGSITNLLITKLMQYFQIYKYKANLRVINTEIIL